MNSKLTTYKLSFLIYKEIIGKFLKIFINNNKFKFPDTIGDYHFIFEFNKTHTFKHYYLGVYENSSGERAILKARSAMIKDYRYYSLLNEIEIYKLFHNVINRNLNDKFMKNIKIKIPKIIQILFHNEYLGILTEYLPGKPIENLNSKEKIKIYFFMLDFLQFVFNHLTNQEKKIISKRSPFNYLILYPILLFKSLISNPKYYKSFLISVPVFLTSFMYLMRDREIALVHRDLHFNNILSYRKSYILLDFQQCVITNPIQEFVLSLKNIWGKDDFYKLLLRAVLAKYKDKRHFYSIFKSLIIVTVIHSFIDKRFSKTIKDRWNDFLIFGLNVENKKKYAFLETVNKVSK